MRSRDGAPAAPTTVARALLLLALAGMLLLAAGGGVAPAHALQPKDRATVRDAFRAAEAGEWQRASRILQPVTDPLPRKTLRWLRMAESEGSESFAEIAGFLMANPKWPLADRLQTVAESRIVDPADHELLRRFFADRPPLTTRGRIRHAEALLHAGENEQARDLFRRAWIEGHFSRTEERKFTRLYGRLLSEQDHVLRLNNLLWDRRRSAASRMLDRVPEDQRRLAEARLRLQRRQPGVDRAIEEVPGTLRDAPALMFDRLRWRRQMGRHDGAVDLLLAPPGELERPGRWWFERRYQIRRALREHEFDLAYQLASRHGQREGLDFAQAEWLAGWLALRFAEQPRAALRRFISLYDGVGTPISRSRASYWAGRAAAALDDDVTAGTWYRIAARHWTTYYGQLAATELDEAPEPPPVLPPSAAEEGGFASRELVRVARLLTEADAAKTAAPFLMRLIDDARTPAEVGQIADLAADSGRPDLVTLVGKYASYGGVINAAAAFPIPDIAPLLRPAANDLEPALVLGVARQESVFDPFAMSRAGARGLLQLMPNTARLMARELGVAYNTGLLTGDPAYNVRLGSRYLAKMQERYGDPGLALAAYNAGPSRVDAWLRLHGDPRAGDRYKLIDWLELIPFDETRNYVQRVLENYRVYRRLLAQPEPPVVAVRPVAGPIEPPPRPALRPSMPTAPAPQVAEQEEPAPMPEPAAAPAPGSQSLLVPAALSSPPLPKLKPSSVALAPTPEAKPSG